MDTQIARVMEYEKKAFIDVNGRLADLLSELLERISDSEEAEEEAIDKRIAAENTVTLLVEAITDCLGDLEHYAKTHGPGPDRRLENLRAVLASI